MWFILLRFFTGSTGSTGFIYQNINIYVNLPKMFFGHLEFS